MSKILLIGNVIKDVYLALDSRTNSFETDDSGTSWLDLAFDGRSYKFYERSSILGGVAVSLEVMQKMGLDVDVMSGTVEMDNGKATAKDCNHEYRYILTHDDEICYLTSDERRPAQWEPPKDAIEWLYIDRTVTVTRDLLQKIKSYISLSQKTRIAYYLGRNESSYEKELVKISNIIFCDTRPDKLDTKAIICQISDTEIAMGPLRMEWLADRAGLRTHLTMYSTIAATVFSALLTGKSARDALLLAKLNVENSSLNHVLTSKKLSQLLTDTRETERNVAQIAGSLMRGHKGILAADESGGSIHKKFLSANIPDDEPHRRSYRNVLLTAKNLERYVNGVIMFDETIHQKADNDQNFVEYLTSIGIVPGVKVDQGLKPLPHTTENYTAGLDGLLMRLQDYHDFGLRFAKWRAAFEVKLENDIVLTPSPLAITTNCEILARYAKSCQIAGLVPIVEPELVYDGNYSIQDCAKITGQILDELVKKLHEFDVNLEGCILKVNMVQAGKQFTTQSTPEEVAQATSKTLKEHLPDRLAGVVFLSGGQSPETATANLAAIISAGPYPWPVSFSFARAVQDPALSAWQGNNRNTLKAQTALIERLIANQKALS